MSRVPAYLHVGTRSQQVVETALHAGFDGVVLDLQHGELDLGSTSTILRSVPGCVERTLVRVPSLEPGVIGTVLDAGAGGIIAPCVESAEEAAAVVAATKFAPVGARSLGPRRPGLYDDADPTGDANWRVWAIVQIESQLGVERREEILAVEGLDGVYVGPADLALTMGEAPRLDWEDGPVREAIDAVLATAGENGLSRGIFSVSGSYARGLAEAGFIDFVGLGSDLGLMAQATRSLLEGFN
ncbi:4-hydroxy-2-oxoheptanedioate aldolase [Nocardioides sp. J9]|uniref:HpcH/HpaI aldolase family protein n=1 Tax=unclassified Nocardioides TaxID=2615069 RepID=UPI0004B3DF0C|nr:MULTISPECIES: aldolase/citrate lyase family protein [unclassified Nocardioides]TWG94998.1 4-hydroxy-2-oxoheptanedioate aldolase [Nocardioides sp. J9]